MKLPSVLLALVVAIITLFSGAALTAEHVFAGRVLPGIKLGQMPLTGIRQDTLDNVINAYQQQLTGQTVLLQLRGRSARLSLADIGISFDSQSATDAITQATLRDILYGRRTIVPQLVLDPDQLEMSIARHFPGLITPPQNATLTLSGLKPLTPVPSRHGERVNGQVLRQHIAERLKQNSWTKPIQLNITEEPASIQDNEIEPALKFAQELLKSGLHFIYAEENFHLKPYTARRLLTFGEQKDPQNPANRILGVRLDPPGLEDYLQKTLAPAVNQEAQNARFELIDGRVTQFALPQPGQALNIPRTISHVSTSLARSERTVPLAVDVTAPEVTNSADIDQLGLTSLLAIGESDFAGSPRNRIHNITVGAARYHGLLIPPGANFSFNEFLGPVDAASGFKPELVIKKNVTTPEYGGGLCQVSTTAFRAALNAGLEITKRRNHAYAVSYYGTPGLDATIYPPYTDLQFRNNTPGYILIQTNIIGTKLAFEFWGTSDGRQIAVSQPVTYDRQPDGAVKAYVEQKVTKDNQVIIDDTFYSRYKSPKLFPKVLSANGEAATP